MPNPSNTDVVEVNIQPDLSRLRDRNRKVLNLLIQASELIDKVYLEQRNQEPDTIPRTFNKDETPYFYPEGMTREEFEKALENQQNTDDLKSHLTVVRRQGDKFKAIPYSELHSDKLQKAAELLREAADITTHPGLRDFLRARAKALVSNHYEASDMMWVRLTNSPLEITIGPFESYIDKFMGIKRVFESIIGINLPSETSRIQKYKELAQELDQMLSEKFDYEMSGGTNPLLVVNQVYGAGDTRYNIVPIAYNLPNDESIRHKVGSKKVFLRNILDAKFEKMKVPQADRILSESGAKRISREANFLRIIGHEFVHGIGINFNVPYLKEIGGALEELKADAFAYLFLMFLEEKGEIDRELILSTVYNQAVRSADYMRCDLNKDHATANLILYQWLRDWGVYEFSGENIIVNEENCFEAFKELANRLVELWEFESYDRAKGFHDAWKITNEETEQIASIIRGTPREIQPVFDI